MTTETENLIDKLTADLRPIKAAESPFRRISVWLLAGLLWVAGCIYLDGLRPDIFNKVSNWPYLTEIALSVVLFLSAGWSLSYLAVPDQAGKTYSLYSPLIIAALIPLVSFYTLAGAVDLSPEQFSYHHCFGTTLVMVLGPAIILTIFGKYRGYTTRPFMSAVMAILAASALGWLSMRLTCPVDHVQHVFMQHFTPLLIPGILLAGLARMLFRW